MIWNIESYLLNLSLNASISVQFFQFVTSYLHFPELFMFSHVCIICLFLASPLVFTYHHFYISPLYITFTKSGKILQPGSKVFYPMDILICEQLCIPHTGLICLSIYCIYFKHFKSCFYVCQPWQMPDTYSTLRKKWKRKERRWRGEERKEEKQIMFGILIRMSNCPK